MVPHRPNGELEARRSASRWWSEQDPWTANHLRSAQFGSNPTGTAGRLELATTLVHLPLQLLSVAPSAPPAASDCENRQEAPHQVRVGPAHHRIAPRRVGSDALLKKVLPLKAQDVGSAKKKALVTLVVHTARQSLL